MWPLELFLPKDEVEILPFVRILEVLGLNLGHRLVLTEAFRSFPQSFRVSAEIVI